MQRFMAIERQVWREQSAGQRLSLDREAHDLSLALPCPILTYGATEGD